MRDVILMTRTGLVPGEDPRNDARLISLRLRTLPFRGRSLPGEMPPRITVVGSLNTDLVIRAPHLPSVGETVTGGEFATFPGGKGANQAVAAARLGARVAMVGCVGGDDFGRRLTDGLRQDGVDVTHVPVDAVLAAARLAHARGVRVVLDPAPAPRQPLPAELYRLVDVLNPNEGEAAALSAVTVTDEGAAGIAAEHLLRKGARAAVIKLGARGAFVHDGKRAEMVPGIRVDAVDTTAAGDAFAGALAVGLAEGKDLIDAVHFATTAGALSVTRHGAQPSMPFRAEVDAFAQAQRTVP